MQWKFGTNVLFQMFFVWLGTSLASDIIHQTHFVGVKGNMGLQCTDCHMVVLEPGSSRLALDQAACVTCHSPDGRIDGMLDPEIGAFNPANWPENNGESKIFDRNGTLRPGKEKWCLGCHDDGTSIIHGIPAPNIAGKHADGDWKSPETALGGHLQGVPYLLDNDLSTGIKDTKTTEMIFDLGKVDDVSHIRVYSILDQASQWEIYGSKDLTSWSRILYGQGVIYTKPVWKIEPVKGWTEMRLDRFDLIRYIKLVKILPALLPANSITEFQFKSDLKYGYLENGHKIRCDKCHNTASIHVDGVSRTYKSNNNNYNAGYRLSKVKVGTATVDALEIPRVNCNDKQNSKQGNDFALCFSCHDRYKLLGDAYGTGDFFQVFPQTNFKNESKRDTNGNVINEHLRHVSGRSGCGNSKDWDSDWDGVPDSPQSCTACHNIHGSPNPAMTRHGELESTPGTSDKVPMFNFRYRNASGAVDPALYDVLQSTGGQLQYFSGGAGSVGKNFTCNMCHGDQPTYSRQPLVLEPLSE